MWGWISWKSCKLRGFKLEQRKVLKTPIVQKITEAIIPKAQANNEMSLFDFVIGWEWSFQAKAFCDDYYKRNWKLIRKKWKDCGRWSIWYGTISYWGEVITLEEGKARMVRYLENVYNKIPNCWTERQKIAISDMTYQFWGAYMKLNTYVQRCDYNSVKYVLYPYNRYLTGVQKRRVRGYNYFLWQ